MSSMLHTARKAPISVRYLEGKGGVGVFADTALPAGFALGELGPGGIPLGPDTDAVFAQHYTMKVYNTLCVGMQPIDFISKNSRNPMHLLNSACVAFNGRTRSSNAKVCKLDQVVRLTHEVGKNQQIFLTYRENPNLSVTTSPSDGHPDWMKDAASFKLGKTIPVWALDRAEGRQLFFIVPPDEYPLPPKSISLSSSEKEALIRSLSVSIQPLTKSVSMSEEKKLKLLESLSDELTVPCDSGNSLKRQSSDTTVILERASSSTITPYDRGAWSSTIAFGDGQSAMFAYNAVVKGERATDMHTVLPAPDSDSSAPDSDSSSVHTDEGHAHTRLFVPTGTPEGIEGIMAEWEEDPSNTDGGSERSSTGALPPFRPAYNVDEVKESHLPLYVSMKLTVPRVVRPRADPLRPYRMKSRNQREAPLQRPAAFAKYLGMTYGELEHIVQSVCCAKWKCYSFIDTREVMEARAKTCSISLEELYTWVHSQLEAMSTPSGSVQYFFQTEEVCKEMWQRIFAIGDAVLARARRLLDNNASVYIKLNSTQAEVSDIVSILLCERFSIDPEICTDGKWKIQEMASDAGVHRYVREHWKEACQRFGGSQRVNHLQPPDDNTINEVWRTDYKHVTLMRAGDFSKDDICTELAAEHARGFKSTAEAQDWRRRNQLHHKMHRKVRLEAWQKKKSAPHDQHSLVISTDMKPPVKIPSCRRRSKDFKGKMVFRLCIGMTTCHTTDTHFIFAYLEGAVDKGVNSNITMLAAMIHWELWQAKTMPAWKLNLYWDGAGDNVAWPMLGFGCHVVANDVYGEFQSNRMVKGHGHDGDDQDFRVMQIGWNTTFLTTNLAQALLKLLLAFKTKRERYVIMLLTCNYDWQTLYSPCMNKHFKNYARPLAWRIRKTEPGALPTAEVKTWGAAQPEWHGVNDDPKGDPIKLFVNRPASNLPPKLPVGAFVNPRLKKDIRTLAKYQSAQEREWVEEMLQAKNLTRIYFDGAYGDGGLPGRPAHMECVDATGKVWRVELRVVDELPSNWMELPPQRAEKIQALHQLTPEELQSLPRTYFCNDRNPPAHPPWRGARELTADERLAQDIAFGNTTEPWRKVSLLLQECSDKEAFQAKHMVVKELKQWLRLHGVASQNADRKQFLKPKLVDLAWEHFQVCACGLEEHDDEKAPPAVQPEPDPEGAALASGIVRGRGGNRARGRRRGRRAAGSGRGRAQKRAQGAQASEQHVAGRGRAHKRARRPSVQHPGSWPWKCPTCGFLNEEGGDVCELCNWPDPVSGMEGTTDSDDDDEPLA